MGLACARCGTKRNFTAVFSGDLATDTYVCPNCAQKERDCIESVKRAAEKIIVSTTPTIDGYWVRNYIGIESVEFVIGTGPLSEISSSFSDLFGQRSSAFESKLAMAKKHVMDALKVVAVQKGADAVIGIDLDYTEFSGNRVGLVISGTLVQLERKQPGGGPE